MTLIVSCTDSSNTGTGTSNYDGTYSGTYTGDDRGEVVVVIINGVITSGSGRSSVLDQTFTITGSVSGSGAFKATASTGAVFTGTISSAGIATGAWKSGANNGTFSVKR